MGLRIRSHNWGGIRSALPYAFNGQCVAMLSGVLNTARVVRVNIEIMRAFMRIRRILSDNKDFGQVA